MAESKGCAKAFRRVTRGWAETTCSPECEPSNMRDCVATLGDYFTGIRERGHTCSASSTIAFVDVQPTATGPGFRSLRDQPGTDWESPLRAGFKISSPLSCTAQKPLPAECFSYFLAAPALEAASAYFLVKRSTRPAVSTSFCFPVKNGWQFEQISTRSMSPLMVERVWNVWPQAQCTVTG